MRPSLMPARSTPGATTLASAMEAMDAAADGGTSAPVVLSEELDVPFWVVQDDANIYISDHEAILTVPKAGGALVRFSTDVFLDPREIAVDDTNIYWTTFYPGRVRQAPKGGGPSTILGDGTADTKGIVVRAGEVFFVEHEQSGMIVRVPVGGGALVPVDSARYADAITIDDDWVWWSDDRGVHKVRRDGSEATLFSEFAANRLLVDDTDVYWIGTSPNSLVRKAKSAAFGDAPEVLAASLNYARYFALDGDDIYWTEAGAGLVHRAKKDGSQGEILARDRISPDLLLVDAGFVYWVERPSEAAPNGQLVRLPK